MKNWSTSLVVLAVTFVSALAITMALVLLIVQDRGATTATGPTDTPVADDRGRRRPDPDRRIADGQRRQDRNV